MIELFTIANSGDLSGSGDFTICRRVELQGSALRNPESLSVRQFLSDRKTADGIAVGLHSDRDLLREQLQILRTSTGGTLAEGSVIIRSGSIVSTVMSELVDERLEVLLQPLSLRDMICLSERDLLSAATDETLWSLAVAKVQRVRSVDCRVCPEQFPEAGPGSARVSAELLQHRIESVLSCFKLGRYQHSCALAGILLLWDHLDASHEISQSLEGRGSPRTADYWHGIMHRREPDPGNAAYWFRTLGTHPAFADLYENLPGWLEKMGVDGGAESLIGEQLLNQSTWNPYRFIDLCRIALKQPNGPADQAVRIVQFLEMLNLIKFSMNDSQR